MGIRKHTKPCPETVSVVSDMSHRHETLSTSSGSHLSKQVNLSIKPSISHYYHTHNIVQVHDFASSPHQNTYWLQVVDREEHITSRFTVYLAKS
jgi:hypothetical protein